MNEHICRDGTKINYIAAAPVNGSRRTKKQGNIIKIARKLLEFSKAFCDESSAASIAMFLDDNGKISFEINPASGGIALTTPPYADGSGLLYCQEYIKQCRLYDCAKGWHAIEKVSDATWRTVNPVIPIDILKQISPTASQNVTFAA